MAVADDPSGTGSARRILAKVLADRARSIPPEHRAQRRSLAERRYARAVMAGTDTQLAARAEIIALSALMAQQDPEQALLDEVGAELEACPLHTLIRAPGGRPRPYG